MTELDSHHELPAGDELLDLPPPHHRPGKSWLFALVLASITMFVLTVALLALGMNLLAIVFIAPAAFIFVVMTAHALGERLH